MNYQKILFEGVKSLKSKNIINPKLDVELILSKVLKINRGKILLNYQNNLNIKQEKKFYYYLSKRKKNEPIAYIIGYKYFWKYKFFVNKSVLIPRPDTEHLIEESLNYIPNDKSYKILDIGTGSGCIIISVLKERPKCSGTAIDISSKAIKVAKTNAKLHHLENNIKFINIDIDKFNTYKYDLIITNPPYINNIEFKRLGDNVKLYEPKLALNGGLDGFELIKKIIKKSTILLKKNGKFIIEIGYSQKNECLKLLKMNGFYVNKICKDFSGKDRCIVSTKNI